MSGSCSYYTSSHASFLFRSNPPDGLAFDVSGKICVADYGNNGVRQIVQVNGVIPPSSTSVTIGTFRGTQAVDEDLAGNLYVGGSMGSNGGLSGSVYKSGPIRLANCTGCDGGSGSIIC